MLPWSRAAPASPTSNPPSFHRRGSSSLSTSTSQSSGTGKLRKGKAARQGTAGEEVDEQDDCWDENSDDEATRAELRQQTHTLGKLSISRSGSAGTGSGAAGSPATPRAAAEATPTKQTSPTSTSSPSSWSFNPFSIIAPAGPKSPSSSISAPLPGPEAVAAALGGAAPSTTSTTRPPARAGGASYLASASQVQAEADKQVKEEERAKRAPSIEVDRERKEGEAVDDTEAPEQEDAAEKEKRRRGSTYQMDQWKAAIKSDVLEIVKDPISLLSRLSADTPPSDPPPFVPPSPLAPSHAHRASISSLKPASEAAGAESDGEEDPAAGYVQLDATNFSSGGPEIVDLSKEEDPEEAESGEKVRERRRRRKFFEVLGSENVDLTELRALAWAGIPNELRPMAWQLLLGYLPAPSTRRLPILARKRQEYADAVRLAFSRGVAGLDGPIWHQISIDVPRTNSSVRLWQGEGTQRSLERILYVWAIRHPASGYVQGINDLVTPFFQVFLSSYIDTDPELYDVSALPPSVLEALEADSFWCLSKLLDGIQDNYIFAQPGIQRQVAKMRTVCERVDAPLARHLEENSVEFIQFAFRWMNCLLMREMSVKNIVRMWDTYLAEGSDAFSEFHLYVCLAFLVKWSDQLREMDFQSIIMFLQALPTQDWGDKNIELLLSEAFLWSRIFGPK